MGRNVQFNEAYFERLGRSPGVEKLVRDATEKVAEQARQDAPVDTKDYRNSIAVEKSPRPGRVVYRAIAKDPKSMLVEARTGTLARAVKKVAGG